MPDRKKYTPSWLTIVLALLFGLFAAGVGIEQELRGRASRGWQATIGTVVGTSVRAETSSMGAPLAATRTRYYGEVRYRFDFGGRSYESTSYDVSGARDFATEDRARAFVADHPVGSELEVHVDPVAPSRSVVAAGRGRAGRFLLVTGSSVTLFGVLLLISRLRRRAVHARRS